MDAQVQSRVAQPAQHLPFEVVALVLQGGGALGAYQAGVYEALSEAGIHPNWIAGISIGAINAAIIAGNAPDDRGDAGNVRWAVAWRRQRILPFRAGRRDAPIAQPNERRPCDDKRRAGFLQGAPNAAVASARRNNR